MSRKPVYTKEQLVGQLKKLSKKLNKIPTKKDFNAAKHTASTQAVKSLFGHWENFLKAADMYIEPVALIPKKEVIEKTKELSQKLGYIPSFKELDSLFPHNEIRIYFKNLDNLIAEAHLEEPRKVCKKRALAQIQALTVELKKIPSMKEFDESVHTDIGSFTAARLFGGSWHAFIEAANLANYLPKNQLEDSTSQDDKCRDKMIKKFQRLKRKFHKNPTIHVFDQDPEYGTKYLAQKYFGSWNSFIDAANTNFVFEEEDENEIENVKKQLIEEVIILANKLGATPTASQFVEATDNTYYKIKKYYKTWPSLIKDAGLDPVAESKRKRIIKQFLHLRDELGRNPTKKEFDQDLGTVTVATVLGYFDSWDSLATEAMKIAI